MTALAVALKEEVRRLARKEVKAQTAATVRAVAQHRREIAKLKRQLRDQEKQIRAAASHGPLRQAAQATSRDLDGGLRFSARSAKAQRRRTGLPAADYAKLVGVSPLTIYNWENGKSRPRREQFASLVAIRGLGKREAAAKLAELESATKPASKIRRSPRRKN